MRALGIEPVHDTRATFRALCDAMGRPGTVQSVPATPSDHAVVATLVDNEVTVHTPDDAVREALAAAGRYEPAPATTADVVHADGPPTWDVRDLERGSLLEPSDGATVVYRVETIDEGATGATTAVTVTGPGVPAVRTVGVSLPGPEIEALSEAQSTYPRGVDAIVAAGDRVVAFPRSLSLEVA